MQCYVQCLYLTLTSIRVVCLKNKLETQKSSMQNKPACYTVSLKLQVANAKKKKASSAFLSATVAQFRLWLNTSLIASNSENKSSRLIFLFVMVFDLLLFLSLHLFVKHFVKESLNKVYSSHCYYMLNLTITCHSWC